MDHCKYCMLPLPDPTVRFCPKCGKDLTAAQPEHHLMPGTILDRKIEVGAALGEGGFGITYIARDTRLNLRVAVKEYYPYGFVNRNAVTSAAVSSSTNEEQKAFFEKGRARFLQEAQTLARFSGEPGIVDVRDFFEENNTAYIVMEFLEGETLKDYLKKNGRLSPAETLRLLTPVMRSLSHLHKENLIHRDVSPDNIMLAKNGVKLLDFGAARFVEGDQKSLSVMLKHGYAPYEQYQTHGNQGPWTDVYALCATMYRCITGTHPPEATDRLLDDKIALPSALGVNVDPGFEAALIKGLAVRPADRWQTMDELLAALQRQNKPAAPKAPPAPPPRPDVTQTAFVPVNAVPNSPSPVRAPPQRQSPSAETPVSPPPVPQQTADEQTEEKKRRKTVIIAVAAALFLIAAAVTIKVLFFTVKNENAIDRTTDGSTLPTFSAYVPAGNENVGTDVGNICKFGRYEQDNVVSNGKEKIEWLILKKDGSKALVISKYILDCHPYHSSNASVTWETSDLRQWLNDDFYNSAFSSNEKNQIRNTQISADVNPVYSTLPGNETTDKLFLLSINEANTYFGSDDARKCMPTAYAKNQGCYSYDYTECCWWWLRSPGRSSANAAEISINGSVYGRGSSVSNGIGGIRPAMWIELDQ